MDGGKHVRNKGFTLLEMTLAMALTVIVALLGLTALRTSIRTVALADAKDTVQRNLRDVLAEVTAEVQLAASQDDAPTVYAIRTVGEAQAEIVFQVPLDNAGANWSTPITYRFVNEDANGNGKLDEGEDADGDGALARHIARVQDDVTRVVAAANNVSQARFVLNDTRKMLTVTLTASKLAGMGGAPAEGSTTTRILILN